MYEDFYGLHSKPFQLNPDPTFYYSSKQHRRAKAYLDYGVLRNEGFIVITGEVGAGKTTIVRGLLDSLEASKVVAAQLVSTQLDAEDTLRMVGAAFGVKTKDVSKADLLMALEVFLVSQAGQGKRCLLIVDEAQNLTQRAVEELRMLSNFQFGTQALLQSFLVGQPEFRQILQDPKMRQLRQRVIAACHIGPLDLEETRAYIEHRLTLAGSTGRPVFDDQAYEAIFRLSGGIPRRVNAVCDRLLLLGFISNKERLTVSDVGEVESEFRDELGEGLIGAKIDDADGQRNGTRQNHATQPRGAFLGRHEGTAAPDFGAGDEGQHREEGTLSTFEERISRLEKSNHEVLSLLQKLITDHQSITIDAAAL